MSEIDTSTAAIAALMEGVTAGPWEQDGPISAKIVWSGPDVRVCFMASDGPASKNARFIAAARELVPALTDERDAAVARAEQAEAREAEALRRENARLMAEIAELDFLRHEGGSDSVAAMEAMLRGAVLPILRAYAEDLLRCVSVGDDPATISGADWRDIADVLDAVCEAERFVGRPDDEYGALLNPVLDARTWEGHR